MDRESAASHRQRQIERMAGLEEENELLRLQLAAAAAREHCWQHQKVLLSHAYLRDTSHVGRPRIWLHQCCIAAAGSHVCVRLHPTPGSYSSPSQVTSMSCFCLSFCTQLAPMLTGLCSRLTTAQAQLLAAFALPDAESVCRAFWQVLKGDHPALRQAPLPHVDGLVSPPCYAQAA